MHNICIKCGMELRIDTLCQWICHASSLERFLRKQYAIILRKYFYAIITQLLRIHYAIKLRIFTHLLRNIYLRIYYADYACITQLYYADFTQILLRNNYAIITHTLRNQITHIYASFTQIYLCIYYADYAFITQLYYADFTQILLRIDYACDAFLRNWITQILRK